MQTKSVLGACKSAHANARSLSVRARKDKEPCLPHLVLLASLFNHTSLFAFQCAHRPPPSRPTIKETHQRRRLNSLLSILSCLAAFFLSFFMFTSRVLPRPVPFTEHHPHVSSNTAAGSDVVYPVPSTAAPGVSLPVPASQRPDALIDNRIIMPGEREKGAVHEHSSAASPARSRRMRSVSPQRDSRTAEDRPSPESIDDKQSVDTEASAASGPATARNRRKRRLSQVNEPSTTKGLAATPVASTQQRERHASVADSPSQICLCQPDPKVPRPRNGMSSS